MKKVDFESLDKTIREATDESYYDLIRGKNLSFWEMDACALYYGEGIRGFNKWCRVTGLHKEEYWEKRKKIVGVCNGV